MFAKPAECNTIRSAPNKSDNFLSSIFRDLILPPFSVYSLCRSIEFQSCDWSFFITPMTYSMTGSCCSGLSDLVAANVT